MLGNSSGKDNKIRKHFIWSILLHEKFKMSRILFNKSKEKVLKYTEEAHKEEKLIPKKVLLKIFSQTCVGKNNTLNVRLKIKNQIQP